MRTRSRDNVSRPARAANAGMHAGRIRGAFAEMRMKAEEAQDAQIILRDPLSRIADEAHAPRRDVGEAADIIVHHAVWRRPTAH